MCPSGNCRLDIMGRWLRLLWCGCRKSACIDRTGLHDGLPHHSVAGVAKSDSKRAALTPAKHTFENHVGLSLPEIKALGRLRPALGRDSSPVLGHVFHRAVNDARPVEKNELATKIDGLATTGSSLEHGYCLLGARRKYV